MTTELADIAEQLKEARRYVRRDILVATKMIFDAIPPIIFAPVQTPRIKRLTENLKIGLEYIQVDPGVLEGYIDGAVFELKLKGDA